MTEHASNLPCQFPKTARLAAMILVSPIIEFQIKHHPGLAKGKYSVERVKAIIDASEIPIPHTVLRSITVQESLSINEVMLSLKHDPELRRKLPDLAQAIGTMHDNLLKLVECGLKNERVAPDIFKAFSTADDVALRIFKPTPSALSDAAKNMITHLLPKMIEIQNSFLRETKVQGPPRIS